MSNKKESPLPPNTSELATQPCPPVANLIDFAVGQTETAVEQQVRNHLLIDHCSFCRSWVEQAARHRGGPSVDWTKMTVAPFASLTSLAPSPDPTPVPESAKWQSRALRDLERRLALLEES